MATADLKIDPVLNFESSKTLLTPLLERSYQSKHKFQSPVGHVFPYCFPSPYVVALIAHDYSKIPLDIIWSEKRYNRI
ncbi:hypothetical protein P691DRAFT_805452, partial [Macrolepiota fuliginosa MF-IS2]